jgi:predicted DNA binding protein
MIQLQFVVPSESWVEHVCRDDLAQVKILSMKVQEPSQYVTHFVDISSDKVHSEELSKALRGFPDVVESDVAAVGLNRVVGAVTSNDCVVCSLILSSKSGYFVGPAATEGDCQISYKLFMGGDDVPDFLQSLHANGVAYKISEISKLSPGRSLTSKQEHVLKSALELGYFDYPKRISTEELSRILGVSPSTVSEILRRAEKRVIRGYFEK